MSLKSSETTQKATRMRKKMLILKDDLPYF